eukprot:TRINITY_DN59143_c0_g1_i2.p1 TRINITY_DN59143_c0_g1~~TRINITY_DN59143_c0_g1_i2.p1  ORF type:complete len:133 (-),score=7.56 TRINITY_DN59143_c0_g1_i2:298-696(-)
MGPPPGVFEAADLYVRKRWRAVQRLADEFWNIWRREYLVSLQARRKWLHPQENIEVGDVVIVHDPNEFRSDWKVGRIVETFPGVDGLVRSAKMLIATSALDARGRRSSSSAFMIRPVHKITILVSDRDHGSN